MGVACGGGGGALAAAGGSQNGRQNEIFEIFLKICGAPPPKFRLIF